MSKLKKTLSMALCAVLSVFAAVIFAAGAGKTTAYAASPIGGEDGRYEMSYDFGGQSGMGKQMLENTSIRLPRSRKSATDTTFRLRSFLLRWKIYRLTLKAVSK